MLISQVKKFWVSLDISKFDQSVLASVLMLTLFLPWFLYNHASPDFPVLEKIILWSVSNSVAKVVKWFGDEWRVIFGLMFSGELMTSIGDSWYLEIIFECFDQYLADQVGPEMRDKYKRDFRRFKDYGDDGILSHAMWVLQFMAPDRNLGPTLLRDYLKIYWHMDLKLSDTHMSCDSDPRRDPRLPSFYTQLNKDGVGDEISYQGARFLKRYIIKYDTPYGEDDMPWRPTNDYISKISCVAGNNQSEVMQLIRLRALALDTYGTNQRAYDLLRRVHDELFAMCDPVKITKAVVDVITGMSEGAVRWSAEDQNLFERVGGMEGLRIVLMGFPSKKDILARTLWDQDVQDEVDGHFHTKVYMSPEDLFLRKM